MSDERFFAGDSSDPFFTKPLAAASNRESLCFPAAMELNRLLPEKIFDEVQKILGKFYDKAVKEEITLSSRKDLYKYIVNNYEKYSEEIKTDSEFLAGVENALKAPQVVNTVLPTLSVRPGKK